MVVLFSSTFGCFDTVCIWSSLLNVPQTWSKSLRLLTALDRHVFICSCKINQNQHLPTQFCRPAARPFLTHAPVQTLCLCADFSMFPIQRFLGSGLRKAVFFFLSPLALSPGDSGTYYSPRRFHKRTIQLPSAALNRTQCRQEKGLMWAGWL